MLNRLKILLLSLLLILPRIGLSSGTIIRNGGEPVSHSLEATRFALVETLKEIYLDPGIRKELCAEEEPLSDGQRTFCREYLLSILDQIVSLNTDPHQVPFVLRENPLLVEGPDGQPMPVSARTELGSRGPIEFHLDSIKLMAPKVLFHLMAHEFQHKTTFEDRNPSDDEEIGPFASGRYLIDSAASALTKIALKKGRIGTAFTIRDSFECVIHSGTSQFGVRAATQRWFFDSSLMNYKLSLSEQPSDPLIYLPESINTKIVFQLQITDRNHCQNLDDKSLRESKIILWREFSDPNIPSVQLSEEVLPGLNPLCEKDSYTFSANYQSVGFECRYYGSFAN